MTKETLVQVNRLNKELALYRETRNLFAAHAVLREIQLLTGVNIQIMG